MNEERSLRQINTSETLKRPTMVREPVSHPDHHTVTTENTYDTMSYIDETEIAHVTSAAVWVATFEDGEERPLVCWVITDDGAVHGVAYTEGQPLDVADNVEEEPGFVRFTRIGG